MNAQSHGKVKDKHSAAGNIILAVVFMLFIFFSGAALLSFTIAHSRIIGVRTKKMVQTNRMVQGLIYYLHRFRQDIFATEMSKYQAPELEFFNTTGFPKEVTADKLEIVPAFGRVSTPLAGYKRTRVYAAFDVFSNSTYRGLESAYQVKSQVLVDILDGEIPLTFFPLFLGEKPGIPSQEYLEENHIADLSGVPIPPGIVEAQLDVVAMAAEALNIPVNTILMWRDIRAKLGLPVSDEPIPDGIYMIVEGNFVRALFIQGDVEQLTFSISTSSEPAIQEIGLVIGGQSYLLRYKPKEKYFLSWNPTIPVDAVFGEKMMVNGNILSVMQQGEAAFSAYANIVLLVSGRTVLSSELRTQAYHLNVGEVQLTSLTLATGLEQLYGMEAGLKDPALLIDTTGEIQVDASIICDGQVTNNSDKLKLTGSLYCQNLENNGHIEITHASSAAFNTDNPQSGPAYLRTVNFKFVSQFLIEFIQEVYND